MTYEYEYYRKDGSRAVVSRTRVPMSKASEPINVEDADGNTYVAKRILSLTAPMKSNWGKNAHVGDLPPTDATPGEVFG